MIKRCVVSTCSRCLVSIWTITLLSLWTKGMRTERLGSPRTKTKAQTWTLETTLTTQANLAAHFTHRPLGP